jgi:transposase
MVKRIDALLAIERDVDGQNADSDLPRQKKIKPLLDEWEAWLRQEREDRAPKGCELTHYLIGRPSLSYQSRQALRML